MARTRVLIDISPLRQSREFRRLYGGQLVSYVGTHLTVVAVPFQVYELTGSSLAVGLVGLAELGPLLVGSIAGGAIADSFDRRRLMLLTQVLLALTSLGLAFNAWRDDPALWPLYVLTAVSAGVSGIDRPARGATVPRLVRPSLLPASNALWQMLLSAGAVAGPALAGLLLSRFGLRAAYVIDAGTFVVAFLAVAALPPLPPVGEARRPSLGTVMEGFRFLRGRRLLAGTFAIDLDAMIFGMPRALFPALADQRFGGGAGTLGLLHSALGAGSLIGALTSGWVGGVHRQGRAVLAAVAVWGAAIAMFGFTSWLPAALVCLALAGGADVISAVFRNTILQSTVPDNLRGRMSSVHIAVVTGGPRIGDVESGIAATALGVHAAVVFGGFASLAGVAVVAWRFPELARYDARVPDVIVEAQPHPAGVNPPEPPPPPDG